MPIPPIVVILSSATQRTSLALILGHADKSLTEAYGLFLLPEPKISPEAILDLCIGSITSSQVWIYRYVTKQHNNH